ncbi:putative Menaquinol oxidoreductase complex ACIII, cytochrome c subunit ActA [Candidatus Nitrospira nitrificans]|uniref:Putative Menaquinol oxidoreductase complex ACIII, cytochrome c subunit ActA n=2 Tax=Candidatus Nitrospira nitrificans TaxID=1742973 RepID=A0A0S4LQ64_9BACT|nr:putative Menaquinol oxidoreductase complex ACIII, cytochrome c subunit ActA [Candidatus Nitrospira nitrificans]
MLAVAVLLFTGVMAAWVGMLYSAGSSDTGDQDMQPVPFSHARHAGRLKVDCLYCHRFASLSATAGVPSVQLCMSCHRNLMKETPDTRKLLGYWERQEPIPWVRLHRLPDFVYFTHEMHLRARLRCIDCHGHVGRVSLTPRAASYEMGWCLTCHQQRGASLDCWTCHK